MDSPSFYLKIKRLDEKAIVPTCKHQSAGYDLSSIVDVTINPGTRAKISTGWSMAIPDSHYGRIASRSGLAADYSIDVAAGVIDSSYRGEILVLLCNNSDKPYTVRVGDRIAQIIFEKISNPELKEVSSLDDTKRCKDGFGSTGLN